MVYYIIIRGPLGCGKSTIAENLTTLLHAEYISIDKALEENKLDKVGPEAECIPVENFIKANEIVIPKVKEKLKTGKIVVFDACFYHKKAIDHLIQNLEYPHYVFTLKAPIEVCIERDMKRKKHLGEDAVRAVHILVSRFDYGAVIDASQPLDTTIKNILFYLPKN